MHMRHDRYAVVQYTLSSTSIMALVASRQGAPDISGREFV